MQVLLLRTKKDPLGQNHWNRITGTWSSLETGSLLVQQINKQD